MNLANYPIYFNYRCGSGQNSLAKIYFISILQYFLSLKSFTTQYSFDLLSVNALLYSSAIKFSAMAGFCRVSITSLLIALGLELSHNSNIFKALKLVSSFIILILSSSVVSNLRSTPNVYHLVPTLICSHNSAIVGFPFKNRLK